MSSVKSRLLGLLKANVGKYVSFEELQKAAGGRSEWARQIRALKQEDGYDIVLGKDSSRMLVSLVPGEKKTRNVSSKTRYLILQRDNSTCQRCGRTPGDDVRLVIDHKIPSEWSADDTVANLWVLCEECNLGKKNWVADMDSEIVKQVMLQKSGMAKLRILFKLSPNVPYDVTLLQVISGVRDWTREIRTIRQDSSLNIRYIKSSDGTVAYVNEVEPLD